MRVEIDHWVYSSTMQSGSGSELVKIKELTLSEEIFDSGNLTLGLCNNSTEPHLCEHLLRGERVKKGLLLQRRGNRTLLGAMPALTVNFVSSNTT
jgi:hypothetical protein